MGYDSQSKSKYFLNKGIFVILIELKNNQRKGFGRTLYYYICIRVLGAEANQAMSDHIPEEIIYQILLKLPVKSVVKFSAVCKSWTSMIKSPIFAQNHLSRTVQSNHKNDAHLLLLNLLAKKEETFSLRWDNPTFGEYKKLVHLFPRNTFPSECVLSVVGTCNGLVCLADLDRSFCETSIVIWNPSIRKYVTLPTNPRTLPTSPSVCGYWRHFAFGYDSRNNDYKVLRIMEQGYWSRRTDPCEFEVWSLTRGSWKIISDAAKNMYVSRTDSPAFVNGALHWVQESLIVWFDMASELFGDIVMPELAFREGLCSMSRYGESLALFDLDRRRTDPNEFTFDMWVMKEYGVAESWTKLFTVNICRSDTLLLAKPFGFIRSEVVLKKLPRRYGESRSLLSVDLNSKLVRDIGIEGYESEIVEYMFMDSFVESLELLGQANASFY